jgi:hypothetical protein
MVSTSAEDAGGAAVMSKAGMALTRRKVSVVFYHGGVAFMAEWNAWDTAGGDPNLLI